MSSPVISIDSSNVGTWTNPSPTPDYWYVFPCFSDGTFAPDSAGYSLQINGSLTSFDFTYSSMPAGYYIKMFGIDTGSNVTHTPAVSDAALHEL